MAREHEENTELPGVIDHCRKIFEAAVKKTASGRDQFIWPVRGETGIIEMVGLEPQDYDSDTDRFVIFGPSLDQRPVLGIATEEGIFPEYQVFRMKRQRGDWRLFELIQKQDFAAADLYVVTAEGNAWEFSYDHFVPVKPADMVTFEGTQLVASAPEWIKL
ncbi:MAG: hypothetical protein QG553_597 [Patescibacteria group bacterium]|nr:hypothetical protein [Patescibacteria group bacterium]